MLLDPAHVDWDAYQALKPCHDPGWGNTANRYSLALRMFEAKMLKYVDKVEEKVGSSPPSRRSSSWTRRRRSGPGWCGTAAG